MSTASRSSLVVKISPCSRLRVSLSIYLSIRRTVSALLAETVSSDNYLIMRLVTRRHTGEAAGEEATIAGGRLRRWRHLLRVLACPTHGLYWWLVHVHWCWRMHCPDLRYGGCPGRVDTRSKEHLLLSV